MDIAKQTRDKSRSKEFKGTVKEILGTCNALGCTVDALTPGEELYDLALKRLQRFYTQARRLLICRRGYKITLLTKSQMQHVGEKAIRMNVMQFGYGNIMPDSKAVDPVINAQKLTDGFTNMAQAFSMAGDMSIKGHPKEAQQFVMLITDGKSSFVYMTDEMIEQLDGKDVIRYFCEACDSHHSVPLGLMSSEARTS